MTAELRTAMTAAVVFAVLAVHPVIGSAESVAYIDKNEVWVSTINGSHKVRLSGGENQWRDVAHSDGGAVVGVKRETTKPMQLSFFAHWNADGRLVHSGILPSDAEGAHIFAAPANIDVTPDGNVIVWGYSAYTYGSPVGRLDVGTYVTSTDNTGGLKPLKIPRATWPTLAGRRLIAVNRRTVRVQDDMPSAPFSDESGFSDWLNLSDALDSSWELETVAASADGKVAAFHFTQRPHSQGKLIGGLILVAGATGLGGDLTGEPACVLQTSGLVERRPSISADGNWIAWQDDQGVKVAPMPTGPDDPCEFPSAPTVISTTGSHPNLGGFKVPAGRGDKTP